MPALLRASVIEISDSIVKLDAGRSGGVRIGMRFAILNDGKSNTPSGEESDGPIRAIVEVIKIYDDNSVARILQSRRLRDIAKNRLSGVGVGLLIGSAVSAITGPIGWLGAFVGAIAGAVAGASIPAVAGVLTQAASVQRIQIGDIAIQMPASAVRH